MTTGSVTLPIVGGMGVQSINGDSSSAQVIQGSGNITVTTTGGTTTIGDTGAVRTVTSQNATTNTTLTTAVPDLIVYCDSTAAAFTITMPDPTLNTNRRFTFTDISGKNSTNAITFARFASESFEGLAANYIWNTAWGCLVWVSNGTNWFVI